MSDQKTSVPGQSPGYMSAWFSINGTGVVAVALVVAGIAVPIGLGSGLLWLGGMLIAGALVVGFLHHTGPSKEIRRLLIEAKLHSDRGDLDQAAASYKEILKDSSVPSYILRDAAMILANSGELEQAVAGLRKYLKDNPSDTDVRMSLVAMLMEKERHAQALEFIEGLPAHVASSQDVANLKAVCWLEEGLVDRVLKELNNLPPLGNTWDRKMVLAHYLYGVALMETGDSHRAIEELKPVYQADRNFEDVEARLEKLGVNLNTDD